ncbi:MAG: acylphosphatase [Gammaproteobacteria bacterium]
MSNCIAFIIEGKVQGVFYRAEAQKEAQRLGLTGFVRNEPEGTVLAVACGEPEALAAFELWLWKGPAHANVSNVRKSTSKLGPFSRFDVVR